MNDLHRLLTTPVFCETRKPVDPLTAKPSRPRRTTILWVGCFLPSASVRLLRISCYSGLFLLRQRRGRVGQSKEAIPAVQRRQNHPIGRVLTGMRWGFMAAISLYATFTLYLHVTVFRYKRIPGDLDTINASPRWRMWSSLVHNQRTYVPRRAAHLTLGVIINCGGERIDHARMV